MGASFACPDCGGRIRLAGLTPGREAICPQCATRVEVPFLPRSSGAPRGERPLARLPGRRRKASANRRLRWALALGSVALVTLATASAVRLIAAGARHEHEQVLGELLAASRQAEQRRDVGGAFREIEAALIRARQVDPPGSARLAEIREQRDRLARAEVTARLAGLAGLDPDRAVGEAQILAERGRKDPALAPLAGAIALGAEAAILRQVEADRDSARADLRACRGIAAFERADRAFRRADGLHDRTAAGRLRDEARALVVEAVGRFGVVVATPAASAGESSPPSAGPTIEEFARPFWIDALAQRGYLIEPVRSDWGGVWAERAPYCATASLVETANELYLQSQNRATQISARFVVAERGVSRWDVRTFAQTRSPIPDLPAFVAGKLATAARRDPEIERRLRDDARAAFRSQTERLLRGIPPADAPPRPGGTPASDPGVDPSGQPT